MSVYGLLELHTFIRRVVALNLPEPVWVRAELVEVDERRGHYYLALMEKTGTGEGVAAQARAVLWSRTAKRWQREHKVLLDTLLQAGREVQLQVEVKFHEHYGMQLQVLDMDPSYTLGQLAQQRQHTIDALMLAGLMQANKLLQLPLVPQRLAVISSPTAAGWQDFTTQLKENPYGYDFSVDLYPAAVQGAQASPEIRRQLRTIERRRTDYDALVIIRGGGARLDLADFDEKELCFAAAGMSLPIISGIGHETDQSILDMLAHTALKTPTAVANFLIDRLLGLDQQLAGVAQRLQQEQIRILRAKSTMLERIDEQLRSARQQLVQRQAWQLEQYATQLPLLVSQRLRRAGEQLDQFTRLHELLSLPSQLKRGFALVSSGDKILTSTAELAKQEHITIHLKDGTISAVPNENIPEKK